ncbi:alpha/beta-hydrolase [Aspergillus piperis CBS 112811]|uniref:Alpha/beta-hydrolase n=1 Tax=Aspergillus piperis CBS 112811 TaxID=1448313 RepID=A0A8G1QQF8_9EURO|nr:alpha/beta-hydrolase [Aspergillus piperis CBS 112811]RAH51714.1 alpha/beta-hydrolase [Aspergillus piperis CBS 112811]
MLGSKGWSSLVSCVLVTVCISPAIVAPSLAKDAQMPLNPHRGSILQWKDCGEANNHTLQCSRLDVPMDHFSQQSDKAFSIPIIRMLAKNASATGDRHIFLNPGGPGASGVGFLRGSASDLNKLIGEDFHLLSFDPRGVSGSMPKAVCYASNAERTAAFASNPWDLQFQAGEMYTRAENKANACEDMMGEYGRYINTPQIAADMDLILDAIGQQKMFYWGLSYGTTLGQTYAQIFPERVSRMVLDGISDLDEWYNSFLFEEYLTDTDKIFTGFVEECFKAKEACPLRSIKGEQSRSPSQLQSHIVSFLRELEEEPIPVYLNSTSYGAITRRSLVRNGILFALYKPSTWPAFAHNLVELLNGNTTPAYNAYSESWVLKYLVDDSTTFIGLNDNRKSGKDAPVHGIKPIYNYVSSRTEMSFLVSKYQGSDIYDRASWSLPTTHGFHPRCYPGSPRVKTAEPILILSTTWDPVCPLISAKKAQNSFEGARLVQQISYGHCTLSMPSLCTVGHLRRYLNEGVLPEPEATCGIDADYFPSARGSAVSTLSVEEEDLLGSLHELATKGVFLIKGQV